MKRPISLIIRPVPIKNDDGSNDMVFGIAEETHPGEKQPGPLLGVPDEAAIPGAQFEKVEPVAAPVSPPTEKPDLRPSGTWCCGRAPGNVKKTTTLELDEGDSGLALDITRSANDCNGHNR